MCQITPERQMEALLKVGKQLLESKEYAMQFFKDAGMSIAQTNKTDKIVNKKKNKK